MNSVVNSDALGLQVAKSRRTLEKADGHFKLDKLLIADIVTEFKLESLEILIPYLVVLSLFFLSYSV
jgi:hypothetical protein